MSSRFKPWLSASRPSAEVDLVRRRTIESVVRSVPVVPLREQRQLSVKDVALVGEQQLPRALVLDRANQPFDNSDAAVLADRPEALTNPAATAPFPKRLVAELLALVSDEMSGYGSGLPNGSAEKRPDRHRVRLLVEHGEAHDPTRVVIDGDGNPPAERPALRQREGEPGCP